MRDWLEIAVTAPAAALDDVAARLAQELVHASGGTEIRTDEVVFWVDVAEAERVLEDTRAAVARLAGEGLPVDESRVVARPAAPEAEWRDAWKRYFRTTRLSRQIVVVPSWDEHTATPDDVIIELDPGQAFGTGAHASTRLVLERMQALHDTGRAVLRMLDVGTGSGILAIAAVKLWPGCRALAHDIDPLAVDVARENVERNRVADLVALSSDALGSIQPAFDLVVANIQADVLRELVGALTERVAIGGTLILSGLLSPQAVEIAELYAPLLPGATAHVHVSEHDREWSAVTVG